METTISLIAFNFHPLYFPVYYALAALSTKVAVEIHNPMYTDEGTMQRAYEIADDRAKYPGMLPIAVGDPSYYDFAADRAPLKLPLIVRAQLYYVGPAHPNKDLVLHYRSGTTAVKCAMDDSIASKVQRKTIRAYSERSKIERKELDGCLTFDKGEAQWFQQHPSGGASLRTRKIDPPPGLWPLAALLVPNRDGLLDTFWPLIADMIKEITHATKLVYCRDVDRDSLVRAVRTVIASTWLGKYLKDYFGDEDPQKEWLKALRTASKYRWFFYDQRLSNRPSDLHPLGRRADSVKLTPLFGVGSDVIDAVQSALHNIDVSTGRDPMASRLPVQKRAGLRKKFAEEQMTPLRTFLHLASGAAEDAYQMKGPNSAAYPTRVCLHLLGLVQEIVTGYIDDEAHVVGGGALKGKGYWETWPYVRFLADQSNSLLRQLYVSARNLRNCFAHHVVTDVGLSPFDSVLASIMIIKLLRMFAEVVYNIAPSEAQPPMNVATMITSFVEGVVSEEMESLFREVCDGTVQKLAQGLFGDVVDASDRLRKNVRVLHLKISDDEEWNSFDLLRRMQSAKPELYCEIDADPGGDTLIDDFREARRQFVPWSFCLLEYYAVWQCMRESAKRTEKSDSLVLDAAFEADFLAYLTYAKEHWC